VYPESVGIATVFADVHKAEGESRGGGQVMPLAGVYTPCPDFEQWVFGMARLFDLSEASGRQRFDFFCSLLRFEWLSTIHALSKCCHFGFGFRIVDEV